MRLLHITLGALMVALAATSVLAGAYLLRAHEGGGLPIMVAFEDTDGIGVDDSVMYGDRAVGRVESVSGGEVRARVGAEHAGFVREGSRFWIQSNLGSAFLCFDSPPDAGVAATPGKRFDGLAARPDPHPSMLPPPVPRKLEARPAWLCDVRAVMTVPEGENLVRDVPRRCAGAIVAATGEKLLLLAPAWLLDQPDKLSERIRVELPGGELRTAQVAAQSAAFCLLAVEGSAWQGAVATPWPDALADRQGLMLSDFEGNAWVAQLRDGALEFRGGLEGGNVALVDGLNLAGFALPAVGNTKGARWLPLDGAAALIASAEPK